MFVLVDTRALAVKSAHVMMLSATMEAAVWCRMVLEFVIVLMGIPEHNAKQLQICVKMSTAAAMVLVAEVTAHVTAGTQDPIVNPP